MKARTAADTTVTGSNFRRRLISANWLRAAAHGIGLKDLLESAALLGDLPEVDLITISIDNLSLMTMELSPAVAAALPQIESLLKDCLEKTVFSIAGR